MPAGLPDGHGPEGPTLRAIPAQCHRDCCWKKSVTAGGIGERLGISATGVRRLTSLMIRRGRPGQYAAAWPLRGDAAGISNCRITRRRQLDHAYDDLAAAAAAAVAIAW